MSVILRVTAGPHQGEEYAFERHDTFIVGRGTGAHFSVPDDGFLSRNHFLIEVDPPRCLLKDLGSTNGTKVNGARVAECRLRDGDVISAGRSTFAVHVEATWAELPRIVCLRCQQAIAPVEVLASARPMTDRSSGSATNASSNPGAIPRPRRATGSSVGSVPAAWGKSTWPAGRRTGSRSPSR